MNERDFFNHATKNHSAFLLEFLNLLEEHQIRSVSSEGWR
jgi:hypothetical protein